jgi:Reversibly glycosylated polypeptide
MSKKIGVVVPSNRPEELAKFKEAWAKQLEESEAKLYVVEDQFETWLDIKKDLGKNAWIIPVRTDCIRSYGYLLALRDGCDYIVTLDDDVLPTGNPILKHVEWLETHIEPGNWTRTLRNGPPTRGLPLLRRVVLNHGLWDGVPDVSAQTQLVGYDPFVFSDPGNEQIIPQAKFYPMSGMNVAWVSELTKFMYFGLQGHTINDPETAWGLHRCGDIIAGIMSKVMIDAWSGVGGAVHSGTPYVYHERASDPVKNLELEKSGLNVPFLYAEWLKGSASYLDMAEKMYHMNSPSRFYCRSLGMAMRVWWELTTKG